MGGLSNLIGSIVGAGSNLGSKAADLFYKDGQVNLQNLATLGGLYAVNRADNSDTLGNFFGVGGGGQPTGYQGGIPKYTAERQAVPMTGDAFDPDRRPGSGGRRYFSDITFVPESGSVPAQQAISDAQKWQLATQNLNNPFSGAGFAAGGLTSLPHNGYYLGGVTDGMADDVPAMIGNSQPAALSDGEFVVPADVVSHLGNGNSDAGAQNLYSMMERVRTDRTGNPEQGKQINPNQYLA